MAGDTPGDSDLMVCRQPFARFKRMLGAQWAERVQKIHSVMNGAKPYTIYTPPEQPLWHIAADMQGCHIILLYFPLDIKMIRH